MKADERALGDEVQRQLEDAGFFVAREVEHIGKRARLQADFVAYAPDESGALKPEIIVEVKGGPGKVDRGSTLAQLSRYALAFDAPRAYLFDGSWYEVDPTFAEAHETVPPRPARRADRTGAVELTPELLRPSIRRALWNVTGSSRAKGKAPSGFSVGMLQDVLGLVGYQFHRWTERHPLDRWPIAKTIAWELLQSHFRSIRLPMALTDGMANLLAAEPNWQVVDPSCGIGTLLLSAGERGARRDHPLLFFGSDRHAGAVDLARALLRFAGADLNVVPRDTTVSHPLIPNGGITFGPIGTRTSERIQLPSGHWTRDGDVIALTSLVSRLAPSGRVVFGTTQRFLFSSALAAYRSYLLETRRIVAVIELPPRSLDGTAVAPVLIVIENATPGETLVARLEDDWATQLSEAGAFYRAYVSHLRRQ